MKMLIAKLNPICKKALEGAAGLCMAKGHYNIELEHFLLKLFELPETDAQLILRYYEIDLQTVLKHFISAVDKFPGGNSGTPVFSKHILNALEEAWLASSLTLGYPSIRSGALLLALIDIDPLRGILLESCPLLLRISRLSLRRDIHDLLGSSKETCPSDSTSKGSSALTPTGEQNGGAQSEAEPAIPESKSALNQYTIDLTAAAQKGKLDPIHGRDVEIRQMIEILSRRRQNNPILVGDAGVGKTAIVEGLACRIRDGNVPPFLQQAHLHRLDVGLLQAGASAKGQFEERINQLLQEVQLSPHPIILFIDEAHTLLGAGGAQGLGDAASLLKPALARGELRTIAATTWAEYKRYIEKDAALTRRFERIKVKEPTPEETVPMLYQIHQQFAVHHDVNILQEALEASAHLSHRFLPERRLPDKAVSVLDTACAQVALSLSGFPEELQTCMSKLHVRELERQIIHQEQKQAMIPHESGPSALHASALHGRLETIGSEIAQLHQQKEAVTDRWQQQKQLIQQTLDIKQQIAELGSAQEHSSEAISLKKQLAHLHQTLQQTPSHELLVSHAVDKLAVARVISSWTGIPIDMILSQGTNIVLEDLVNTLSKRIIGQDYALHAIAKSIVSYQIGLNDSNKPIGVFLLAGPSGVGKTETALALAETMTGHQRHLVHLNMAEFQESHSIAILKGAPPGYIGHGKGGTLTEAVRQNPYSVVLLDEVDRAHSDIISLFAQIFDKGIVEDSEGIEVDFSNTLFILTTNQGEGLIEGKHQRLKETEDRQILFNNLTNQLSDDLRGTFGSSFMSRIAVIPYLPLTTDAIKQIIRLKLDHLQQKITLKYGHSLDHSDELIESIVHLFDGQDKDLRFIDTYLRQHVAAELAKQKGTSGI
ncbi:MAG: type VI secretion system ATPase TssH [Alphaproteobacteria bacterium]|nr:type VI secretion system ATPase TssH [Alphaproteobacteria bacterium]